MHVDVEPRVCRMVRPHVGEVGQSSSVSCRLPLPTSSPLAAPANDDDDSGDDQEPGQADESDVNWRQGRVRVGGGVSRDEGCDAGEGQRGCGRTACGCGYREIDMGES